MMPISEDDFIFNMLFVNTKGRTDVEKAFR